MEKLKKIPLPVAIIIAGAFVALAIIFVNNIKTINSPKAVSADVVSAKVLKYVNETILAGKATATLKSVKDEKGFYIITFTLQNQDIETYATKDGELFFPQGISLAGKTETLPVVKETGKTIGEFSISDAEVCSENGKPVVYFFGSESCVHCKWEEPVLESVVKNFKDQISFHKNIDTETDKDVFGRFNQEGQIPTLIIGCKYYRIGSGESVGEATEKKNLTALFCKLTNNQPAAVCEPVKDIISQIK